MRYTKSIVIALAVSLSASPSLACYDNLSCMQEQQENAINQMQMEQQQQVQQQQLLRQQEDMFRRLQQDQQRSYQADWLRR